MIPTVDDLQSAPLVHRFGDQFNAPALANILGCVQASSVDVTAIRSLNFPPFGCSDSFPPVTWAGSVTAALFIDGDFFPSTGTPITFIWRPDRIKRSAEYDGLRLRSETALVAGKRAVLVRLCVANASGERRRVRLRLGLRSTVTRDPAGWDGAVAPMELDNEAVVDVGRGAVLFRARHSEAVSLQGACPRADAVQRSGLEFERNLDPGEQWQLTYVNVIDAIAELARETYDALVRDPEREFARAREEWNAEIAAAFTPGNSRYSGSLPRLETSDETLRCLYDRGVMGVLYFKREMPHSVIGRTYTTLMPRYWQTLTWLWDYHLSSVAHVLLDPDVAKRSLAHWMSGDTHSFMATDWLTGRGVGRWYAINDHALSRTIRDYVRWSGDREWLLQRIVGEDGRERRVIDLVQGYARTWERFKTENGLADYGSKSNLLECVQAYEHEVAGLNATNVFNLRSAAELLDCLGLGSEAAPLRSDAERLLSAIQRLYVDGKGFWSARRPDGSLVPVRHCFDLLSVLNTIPDSLTSSQKQEMVRFFQEELQTPTWMHALSPRDPDAIFDNRPDHQWSGAFAAWPAETATGLCRIGRSDVVLPWLRGIAITARQGLFGQAHFADGVVAAEAGGACKAPSEFPYLTDWACSAAGAWVRFVLESIFGVDATVADGLRARPIVEQVDRDARLVNLRYQGRLYTVDRTGARLQKGPL